MPLPAPPLVDGFHSQAHKDAFLAAQATATADQGSFTDAQMLAWLRDLRKLVHVIVDADGGKRLYFTVGGHFVSMYWATTHANRQTTVSIGTGTEWAPLYIENETTPAGLSPYHDRECLHALCLGSEMATNPDQSGIEPHLRNRNIGIVVQSRNNMNGSYPIWSDAQYSRPPWNGAQGVFNHILDDDSGAHRGALNKLSGAVNWVLSIIW
mgnify:CR=1 FL=1